MVVPSKSRISCRDDASPAAPDAVELLSRAGSYQEHPPWIERAETHVSWVFLTPHHAYKLKKPVCYEFMDFSTLAVRKQACEAEVRLNRRMAPGVYLGVVPITRTRWGGLRLGGSGTAVDWVVKMRRLPADRSLAALLRATRLAPVQVELLAQRLAEFYHRLPPLTIRAREYRVGIEEHVQANRSELLSEDHGLDPLLVKRVHAAQFRVLRLAPELLEHRACDGRVVEGHGDLRPEHIYCAPEPLAIDCIEFSAELRYLDVLDDLSFLAMECDYLGAGPVGDRILERYVQVSGDRPPRCLVPFYKSYRASVHAKVAALRSRQDEGGEHQDELRLADRYLRLADTYGSQLGPPLVIVVRGLAGSGKSTLAETLSDTLGLEWLQTDGVRRQLLPSEAWSSVVERESYPVYAELLRQAEGLLDQQCSVILDGTFLSSHLVQQAVDLARARQALPLVVECSCPTAVAQQRIRWRLRTEVSLSEATPGLYADQRHAWEPVPHGVSSLKISTTASLPSLIEQVLRYLRESPPLRDILAAP